MKLPSKYKVAFLYINDKCSNIGIWKPNKELCDFCMGEPIDWDGFQKALGPTRLKVLPNGDWWLLKFIDFQYGPLDQKSTSRPIQSYIRELKKHSLLIPYLKGINTLKEKEKDKDKDKDKGGVGGNEKRKDYEINLNAFFQETQNNGWIEELEKEYPELNVLRTLTAIRDYWLTDEGYDRKKKSKAESINWKATFKNGMNKPFNQVLKTKSNGGWDDD